MDGESSGVSIVIASQLTWIARFILLMGAAGVLIWWVKHSIGFDLKRDIDGIERLARKGIKDGDVKKTIPLLVLLIVGVVAAAYIFGGFVH